MAFLVSLLLFIFILSFLVFIHELGHFLAAKFFKIPVNEFAIGFGPILFSKKYKETNYRLRALPLGGFVSLEGEHSSDNPKGFRSRPFFVKFSVLIAGIFMNFIAAIFLLAFFLVGNNRVFVVPSLTEFEFSNVEKQYSFFPIQFFNVEENRGWENVNEGDIAVEVNDQKINSLSEFQEALDSSRGKNINLTFLDIESLVLKKKSIKIGGFVNNFLPIRIVDVEKNSRSEGKLFKDERIIGINGSFFKQTKDFLEILKRAQGTNAVFHFLEDDGNVTTRNIEIENAKEDGSILEIAFIHDQGIKFESISLSDRNTYFVQYKNNILAPLSFTYDVSIYQVKAIFSLLAESFETGDFEEVSMSVGGPIAVGNVVGEVVRFELFETLAPLIGFISLSLAIFNLLPIPALDGGQIAIITFEALRGKKINDETVNKINFIGFAFLIILSILIFAKDIDQFNIITKLIDQFKNILGK